MAQSKKPRKAANRGQNHINLQNFKAMQSLMKSFICGAVQSDMTHTFTVINNQIRKQPDRGRIDAINLIRFKWTLMLGALSRTQENEHIITYYHIITKHEYYLRDLNDIVLERLKTLFKSLDKNQRITTFWLASPAYEQNIDELWSLKMLHHWKVPDVMCTQHELNTQKNHKDIPVFCNDYDWWTKTKWIQFETN